eukprot:TRINITY_DN71737_c0_g1_i1.p1 TRINITY_DN71737_c0_g1~~TRINITY_DN71737_c0_g1_i1.p1  ORF type:complete len:876 (+),score=221.20 TRINITY_DN71737_c0_g1_i1:120-2747(+)
MKLSERVRGTGQSAASAHFTEALAEAQPHVAAHAAARGEVLPPMPPPPGPPPVRAAQAGRSSPAVVASWLTDLQQAAEAAQTTAMQHVQSAAQMTTQQGPVYLAAAQAAIADGVKRLDPAVQEIREQIGVRSGDVFPLVAGRSQDAGDSARPAPAESTSDSALPCAPAAAMPRAVGAAAPSASAGERMGSPPEPAAVGSGAPPVSQAATPAVAQFQEQAAKLAPAVEELQQKLVPVVADVQGQLARRGQEMNELAVEHLGPKAAAYMQASQAGVAGIAAEAQRLAQPVLREVGADLEDMKQQFGEGAAQGTSVAVKHAVTGAVKAYVAGLGAIEGVKMAGVEAALESMQLAMNEAYTKLPEDQRVLIEAHCETAKGAAYDGAVKAGELGVEAVRLYEVAAGEAQVAVRRAANEAYEELPEDERQLIEQHRAKAREQREVMKVQMLKYSKPIRSSILDGLKNMAKRKATRDRDMPDLVRKQVQAAVDDVWVDVKEEVEAEFEKVIVTVDDTSQQGYALSRCSPLRLRAFFLYHMLPYDRTIFGQMRDPVWWFLTLLSICPLYCARVLFFSVTLAFIVFPHGPDEFQLSEYIIRFKGMQFLSGGILASLLGALQYYVILNFTDDPAAALDKSQRRGPGALDGTLVELGDFVGSVLLAWAAFMALPYSKSKRSLLPSVAAARAPLEGVPEEGGRKCCGRRRQKKAARGGRLGRLLWYDMACFLTTVLVFLSLSAATWGVGLWDDLSLLQVALDWRFGANLFWARVFYSFTTLPFVVFYLPIVAKVLTHAEPTGYNELGLCVRREYRLISDDSDEAAGTMSQGTESPADQSQRSADQGPTDVVAPHLQAPKAQLAGKPAEPDKVGEAPPPLPLPPPPVR